MYDWGAITQETYHAMNDRLKQHPNYPDLFAENRLIWPAGDVVSRERFCREQSLTGG